MHRVAGGGVVGEFIAELGGICRAAIDRHQRQGGPGGQQSAASEQSHGVSLQVRALWRRVSVAGIFAKRRFVAMGRVPVERSKVAAVLLAGGQGSRMAADGQGGDKPLRLLGGRALLDHAIARVAPQVGAMVLNANGDPTRFAAWGLEVVADKLPDFPGPLAGILAGLRWAAQRGFQDVLSVPTDTPFLPIDLLARLDEARQAAGAPLGCAASGGWTHPVIGLWPVTLADALEADLRAGMRKIDAWTAKHGVASAEFATVPFDPFFNVNRPEDLREAEQLMLK
jgi:molybdopterin-guanine dinucleotide biosynthesis protein A